MTRVIRHYPLHFRHHPTKAQGHNYDNVTAPELREEKEYIVPFLDAELRTVNLRNSPATARGQGPLPNVTWFNVLN